MPKKRKTIKYAIIKIKRFQGVAHIYGITELTCWLLRIIVNLIQIVLIQSLYSLWKDEDLLEKRMQTLGGIGINGENCPSLHSQYYQNNGFELEGGDQLDGGLKR